MKPIALATLLLCFTALTSVGCSSGPKTYKSPDEAVDALMAAARSKSPDQLKSILGSKADDLLASGDEVADRNAIEDFVSRYDAKHRLETEPDGRVTVVVGVNDWPMPIPIVKDEKSGTWHFDVEQGKEEMINRRIGRNELDAIQVCLAIVDAQREYFVRDGTADADGNPQFAEKFLSDPGKKNGLFWETAEGQQPSPLGALVAEASDQGYKRSESGEPIPYHGYFYRMLRAQGPNAPGGSRSYVHNGKLVSGFAVIAYPADYENSGIMSFIVNHEGTVFQRDLGDNTAQSAKALTEYDPGPDWQKVEGSATKLVEP